jgi:hypothetical protein
MYMTTPTMANAKCAMTSTDIIAPMIARTKPQNIVSKPSSDMKLGNDISIPSPFRIKKDVLVYKLCTGFQLGIGFQLLFDARLTVCKQTSTHRRWLTDELHGCSVRFCGCDAAGDRMAGVSQCAHASL